MSNAKHTPGPWRSINVENQYRDARGVMKTVAAVIARDVAIARCHSVDDAAFIVRACNAHADMIEALKLFPLFIKEAGEFYFLNKINQWYTYHCIPALEKADTQ